MTDILAVVGSTRFACPDGASVAGPGGFRERNLVIAHTCTRLLRIVCAESKTFGSGWTAARAQDMGKPVRCVVVARDGTYTDTGWPVTATGQLDLLNINGGTS